MFTVHCLALSRPIYYIGNLSYLYFNPELQLWQCDNVILLLKQAHKMFKISDYFYILAYVKFLHIGQVLQTSGDI